MNMGTITLVHVCESATAFALLLFLALHLWPCLRLDRFRQNMFTVRDELFDYAADGNIKFDHQAYKLLRRSMNGFIQYGHRLTFFRLALTVLEWRALHDAPDLKWAESWDRALKTIEDQKVRMALEEFHHRTMGLVLKRL